MAADEAAMGHGALRRYQMAQAVGNRSQGRWRTELSATEARSVLEDAELARYMRRFGYAV